MMRRMGQGANGQFGGQGVAQPQQRGQAFGAAGAAAGARRFGGQGFGHAAARDWSGDQGRFQGNQASFAGSDAAMRDFEDQIIEGTAEKEG